MFESTASGTPETDRAVGTLDSTAAAPGSPLAGATSTTLTITNVNSVSDGFKYRAVFKNTAGKATSNAATLHVLRAPIDHPAAVLAGGQPKAKPRRSRPRRSANRRRPCSGNCRPTAAARGAKSRKRRRPRSSIPSTTLAESGQKYRAAFTNAVGENDDVGGDAHRRAAPGRHPAADTGRQTVEEGESASFESAASGIPTPTVQWEVSTNGGATWSAVAGATSNTAHDRLDDDLAERQRVPRDVHERARQSHERSRRRCTCTRRRP